MRLGLSVGFSGSRVTLPMELIQEADRLGFHSAWTAEAYGSDAVVPATWIAAQTKRLKVGTAIMQMPARARATTCRSCAACGRARNRSSTRASAIKSRIAEQVRAGSAKR
jgi:alkanesulfonate monooxygenase SsuD/methylene tetrahydromethanopterin reductase-like flavin-dependent oxidoreductase (luciferase family)